MAKIEAQNLPVADKNQVKLLAAGFIGGFVQAGLFNPWDRALYLSIKEERPFLHVKNFVNPFAGVSQTIFQRSISSGLYFPLEEIFADMIVSSAIFGTSPSELAPNRTWIALYAGLLAGATNGLLMNPLAAVKYSFWGATESDRGFLHTAKEMFQRGGLRIFFVGSAATVTRDLVFGAFYGVLRHELPWIKQAIWPKLTSTSSQFFSSTMNTKNSPGISTDKDSSTSTDGTPRSTTIGATRDSRIVLQLKPTFGMNLIAASIATIISAPWNYVRNVHYSTPIGEKPVGTLTILRQLWCQAMQEKTIIGKMFHLQRQLRIGWGTARVGCGMAFSSHVYNVISKQLID